MTSQRSRRSRPLHRLLSLIAVLSLILTACGNGGDTATDGPDETSAETETEAQETDTPEELTPVRLAFNPGTVLQLYASMGNDLFEKHGLDVELVQFESGAATNAAFASGDVDMGFTGIPGIAASRLGGAGTQIFMLDNEGAGAEGLVVTPESGISSIADLRGKRIGTVIGTTAWIGLMRALEAEGIDPDEVNIENVAPNAWVPAFENNDVDGIWGWAPLIFRMEQESGGTLIATDADYTITPLFWQVRGGFLDENPEAVESFVAAYDEAFDLVQDRDEDFVADMLERTGVERAIAEATIEAVELIPVEEMVSEDSEYSLTNPEGIPQYMENAMDLLLEEGIFDERPDLQDMINPEPIQNYLDR